MTLLRIEKDGQFKTKEFNSYYLAVVEKNKLLKKGIKSTIIDTRIPLHDDRTVNRDSVLRTVYTAQDRAKLRTLLNKYEPEMNETKKRGRPKIYY